MRQITADYDWTMFTGENEARLGSQPRLAVDGIMEILADPETPRRRKWILPELADVVRRLFSGMRPDGRRLDISRREIVTWIICEVMATDVDFDEIYDWLRHSPTLEEIVFGEDDTSINRLLFHSDVAPALARYTTITESLFDGKVKAKRLLRP